MIRPAPFVALGSLLLSLALTGQARSADSLTACTAGTPCTPIQHVVFIVKENRSFDSIFGTYPGAIGATTFTNSSGQVLPLNHQPEALLTDINHSWTGYQLASDSGKMDKFSGESGAMQNGIDEADSQLYQSDIPNYWTYARDFTLTDEFFSEIAGPTFPNHLFTIAANDNNVMTSPGVGAPPNNGWGCDQASINRVEEMNAKGQTTSVFPCFDNATLADNLDRHSIPWKYYTSLQGQPGYIFSTYDAIKHIRYGPDWVNDVLDRQQFLTDAMAGTLPAVSWLTNLNNDHPPNSICTGENETVSYINAIMSNPTEWAHTAIVLVWDDYGGFFDHVIPPKGPNPRIEYGGRVPAIIISPYARRGYVDHTMYTFSSMLKFVEDLWGLPSLTSMDGQANDMFNAFDFSQQPATPLSLQTRDCTTAVSASRTTGAPSFVGNRD